MAALRSRRHHPPPQWRRGWSVAVLFALSILLNSLAVTAGAARDSGGGRGAPLVIELCSGGHVERVVIRDDAPAPAPPHDCADWCCMLCVSVLPPVGTGDPVAATPAPESTRLALSPAPVLPAWRVQGRSANPRAPPGAVI